MKYIVKTEVQAVLLINKDAQSISDMATMLGPIPHFYTNDGVVFATGEDGMVEQTIAYNNYIVKETHGISVMTKELFESVSDPVSTVSGSMKKLTNNNGITVRQLKELVKDLPETNAEGDDFEVWVGGKNNTSNVCKAIWPLNKRSDGQDIIVEVTP